MGTGAASGDALLNALVANRRDCCILREAGPETAYWL